MGSVTFDAPNKLIIVDQEAGEAITELVAENDIYSRWKDWVLAGNAQWLPAFGESIGGQPLGGGVDVGEYVFVRNDLGWRIRPAERDHQLTIVGELRAADPTLPVFAPTLSPFTVVIALERSALTRVRGTDAQDLRDAMALDLTPGATIEPLSIDRKVENTFAATVAQDDFRAPGDAPTLSTADILDVDLAALDNKAFGEMTEADLDAVFPESGFYTELGEIAKASDDGHYLRFRFIPTAVGSARVQFTPALDPAVDHAFLAFDWYFEDDFEFVRGGKIPGFVGGDVNDAAGGGAGIDGFSTRLMWREAGEANYYIYDPAKPNSDGRDGDEWRFDTPRFRFVPGRWYRIVQELHIGTPGGDDGYGRVWVDGAERIHKAGLSWVPAAGSHQIDALFIATFFGGSDPTWAPSSTVYARMKNLAVASSAAGVGLVDTSTELVADEFDGDLSAWSVHGGSWTITGERLEALGGGGNRILIDPGVADYVVEVDERNEGDTGGVNFRFSAIASRIRVYYSTTVLTLDIDANAPERTITAPISWEVGETKRWRIVAYHSILRVFLDGLLMIETTLDAAELAAITGTQCGPRSSGSANGNTWDRFLVRTVTPEDLA